MNPPRDDRTSLPGDEKAVEVTLPNRSGTEPRENIVAEFRAEMFSGPLPHPAILGGYEQVCPGAAERILAMAEKEQAHTHALRSEHIRENSEATQRGQLFALIIGVSSVIGAVTAPSAVVGGVIATCGLGTLAIAFLGARIASIISQKVKKDPSETPKGK